MAKRSPHPLAGDIQGLIGGLVFYRYKGKPCLRRRPVRTHKFSPAERKNQSRFGQASQYAHAVLQDSVQRARYEQAANGTDLSVQNLAVSDFMHFPVIDEVDLTGYTGRTGERIRIRAEEGNLGAASVRVIIADRNKTVQEEGVATLEGPVSWWSYTAWKEFPPDQPVWITVTASDQPGNKTSKTLRHTTGI